MSLWHHAKIYKVSSDLIELGARLEKWDGSTPMTDVSQDRITDLIGGLARLMDEMNEIRSTAHSNEAIASASTLWSFFHNEYNKAIRLQDINRRYKH